LFYGAEHVAAMNKHSIKLKTIVAYLCSIPLSNRKTPLGLVTACMSIAMCGEHFSDRVQQETLLGVLEEIESEQARSGHREDGAQGSMGAGAKEATGARNACMGVRI
jgi:hypothetical protein